MDTTTMPSENDMSFVGQYKFENSTYKIYVSNTATLLFHIHGIKDSEIKNVCIDYSDNPKFCLYDNYVNRFTDEESKAFDGFLRSPYKYPQNFYMGKLKFTVTTYWEYCIYKWALESETNNMLLQTDNFGCVIYPTQPDYTKVSLLF